MTTCEKCGKEYGVGDWPFCNGGHGKPSKGTTAPDLAYFDIGLGKYINNRGERLAEMKRLKCDYRGKVGEKGCEV